MAKIHILPAQPHGVDQFERLRADLAAAHARGADLGSSAPHIQAGGERLLQLCSELEEAIDDLDWWLTSMACRIRPRIRPYGSC